MSKTPNEQELDDIDDFLEQSLDDLFPQTKTPRAEPNIVMTQYEIWSSGYTVTGGSSPASLMGKSTGKDFKDACDSFFKDNDYYDPKTMRYWGCGLADNERDVQ